MIDWLATAFSSGFLVFLLMDRRVRAQDKRIRELEGLDSLIDDMKTAAINYGEAPDETEADWFMKMYLAEKKIIETLKGGG